MRTPFPWAQADSNPKQVFGDNRGIIDFNRPVAKFIHADDAKLVVNACDIIDEMLSTLRTTLRILEAEHGIRKLSGVPEYVEPIAAAIEFTKHSIARAEGWK
ncbi:MAG TPA: hypothetical protein VK181_04390 [Rhizobium sp.]|nr:hypothetical protein [Rhizobium sp.]